ncbi:MAG: TIGR00159 family protein [Candidatus Xiphinematobacter sp.]|nr:MAG: TIGR00159 family protein [Candidatus Xiphinematobacter sp.]QQY10582.1 MAG: TIGR00159 family protein [Candidatus Xiphinematobacter sp.]QQY11321.1 MAG: TIGR00159 family protein [Candidatus Xiphinematobacter sp.]
MHSALSLLGQYWTATIEIGILTIVFHYICLYLRGTQGGRILIRLVLVFIALTLLSRFFNLTVIEWLLRSLSGFLALALVVIFQPELRRAITELGSNHFLLTTFEKHETLGELVGTIIELSNRGFGALLVIERKISLRPIIETGVAINCDYSKELILTMFHPKTVLHDGAVILHEDHIIAAACILPLTQREDLDRNLGLRHRAALGLTESTDSVAIVVSEETGHISICHNGVIRRNLGAEEFQRQLSHLLLLTET